MRASPITAAAVTMAAVLSAQTTPAMFSPAWYEQYRGAYSAPMAPFRIVGNIHYVGAVNIASYLIATPEGHILPEKYMKNIDLGSGNLSPVDKRTIALAERAPSPSLADNRSLAVRLLLGAGLAAPGAGLGAFTADDNKALGTTLGAEQHMGERE